jgi:hypothetical protein
MSAPHLRIHHDHLCEGVERNIAHVVVPVGQKLAERVDGKYTQPTNTLNTHDGLQYTLQWVVSAKSLMVAHTTLAE